MSSINLCLSNTFVGDCVCCLQLIHDTNENKRHRKCMDYGWTLLYSGSYSLIAGVRWMHSCLFNCSDQPFTAYSHSFRPLFQINVGTFQRKNSQSIWAWTVCLNPNVIPERQATKGAKLWQCCCKAPQISFVIRVLIETHWIKAKSLLFNRDSI